MTGTSGSITMTLQRQISELNGQVAQIATDVVEIKSVVQRMDDRVRQVEHNDAGAHPLMESRIDAAWRRLEEHDKRIENLSQIVARLDHTNRLMTWLGGILGSTVVIWLLTQILGVIR